MSVLQEPTEVRRRYDEEGWCQAPSPLNTRIVDDVRRGVERLSSRRRPEVVLESDSGTVRAIHGCHRYDETSARLVRHPSLVGLAEQLLQAPVYVYQFKVNLKQAHTGAAWPWHQDYAFWHHEDGMAEDRAVNVAVLLDESREENGPLRVIPETHRLGLLHTAAASSQGGSPQPGAGDWRNHVSEDLQYSVDPARAGELVARYGEERVIGPQGAVFAFHPSIVHASSRNTSGRRRALLVITYNAVDNPVLTPHRPEFLVATDRTPVVALSPAELAEAGWPGPERGAACSTF